MVDVYLLGGKQLDNVYTVASVGLEKVSAL